MAGEEENKKGESKGFAGLSSLVSDVSTTPSPASKPTTSTDAEPSTAHRAAQSSPNSQQRPHQAPIEPSSGSSSGGKWALGAAIVVGILWIIGQSNKQPSYSVPTDTPSTQQASAQPLPQVPSRPEEVIPTVGSGLVLSTAQIRYCLAEDIRVAAAKSAVNSYNGSDVDRFNMMVEDYNSRCGSFQYRSGALESARRDVEPYRNQLELEGANRFGQAVAPSAPTNALEPSPVGYANDGAQASELLSQAIAFVSQQQHNWSQNNATSLPEIAATYASNVNYYGKNVPVAVVMEDKQNFATRWPERDYKFYPDFATSRCDASGKCEVSGIVEWNVGSQVRNATSSGKAEVTFEIVSTGGSFQIAKEVGHVLSRTNQANQSGSDATTTGQAGANLEAVLLDALRPGPQNQGRLLDSGKAIVAFANAGFISMKPDQRIDYSDYRSLKKPAYLFGNKIVVIDEEYFAGWIGCCVSPGLAITVRLDGNLAELTSFAQNNKCRLSRDSDDYYSGPQSMLPSAPKGTFATLSCKERDAE